MLNSWNSSSVLNQSISPFGPAKKPSTDTRLNTIIFLIYFSPQIQTFAKYLSDSESYYVFSFFIFAKSSSRQSYESLTPLSMPDGAYHHGPQPIGRQIETLALSCHLAILQISP